MYSFFLDGIQLPIAPPSLRTKIKNQNKTVTLINEGEVNVLKTAGLSEITFTAPLPQVKYPFAVYPNGFKAAAYYLSLLERLKTQKDSNGKYMPFQFIVSRVLPSGKSLFDTNMRVTLENYEVNEDAKDGFDVSVTITLKQYRDYGTKKANITTSASGETVAQIVPERPATNEAQNSYTITAADSLWNIVKKIYGSDAKYSAVYNLNARSISNPNQIAAGQTLLLP